MITIVVVKDTVNTPGVPTEKSLSLPVSQFVDCKRPLPSGGAAIMNIIQAARDVGERRFRVDKEAA